MWEFQIFGAISHLKINFAKSKAMGIAIPSHTLLEFQSSFHFRWTETALKYQGTNIPPDITRTFKLNFPPLLTKARALLDKWHTGYHCWFGRCNLLKMSILPKFIYLIQALPIHIPPLFFKQIHSLFTRFVWAHKRPRLRRTQMTLPKQYGELALPDIRIYYLASHLGRILDWRRNKQSKLWVQLEQSQSHIPLGEQCGATVTSHIDWNLTHSLVPLWRIAPKLLFIHLSRRKILLFSILGNTKFGPGLSPTEFPSLRESGIDHAARFVLAGKWPFISDLCNSVGNYHLPFWKAVQLHNFLHSLPDPQDFAREQTPFESLCAEDTPLAHILSQTYSMLISPTTPPQLHCLASWEKDLHCTFSPTQRQQIISLSLKSSLCTKLQETNFKLLTRWYLTPSRLKKCFPSTSGQCWRCMEGEGTLIHIFWSCPKLKDHPKVHRLCYPGWPRILVITPFLDSHQVIQKVLDTPST